MGGPAKKVKELLLLKLVHSPETKSGFFGRTGFCWFAHALVHFVRCILTDFGSDI